MTCLKNFTTGTCNSSPRKLCCTSTTALWLGCWTFFLCPAVSRHGRLVWFFAEILWRKFIRNRQDLNRSNLVILRSFGWDLFFGGVWGEYKPVVFRDGIRVDFDDLAKEYSWSSTDDSTDRLGQSAGTVEIFHLQDSVQFRRKGRIHGTEMAKATDWIAAGDAVHLQKKIGKKKLRETTISRKKRLKYRNVVQL